MNKDFPFDHFLQDKKGSSAGPGQTRNNNDLSHFFPLNQEEPQIKNDEFDILIKEVLTHLQKNISTDKYNTFFNKKLEIINIDANKVLFKVNTIFIKSIMESNFKLLIQDALQATLGSPYSAEFQVVTEESNTTPASNENQLVGRDKSFKDASFKIDLNPTHDDLISRVESQYIDHMNPDHTGILIDPNKTFDNFIVGPSNHLAFATAIAVSDAPGKRGKYPCLYIYSSSGLGKTHLLHSVANGIKVENPELVICLITARDFMKEMINSIRDKRLPEFQKKYSETIDILMIDDIHELKNKQGTQNEFFHIFNALHNKGKQLIFTSDKAPKEIDGIEDRIKTRLQWGLVIDIQRPDLETRIAILKRKAQELDLYLPDDVLNLIASSFKSSIRELEGSLIKLSAFAELMNVEIDTIMVKDLLKLEDLHEKTVTLESIARATSQFYKIPLADLKSKSRSKEIANARHVAMYLSKKSIDATLKDIAHFYGGRDHSSVIHAVKKVEVKVKSDMNLSRDIIQIENSL